MGELNREEIKTRIRMQEQNGTVPCYRVSVFPLCGTRRMPIEWVLEDIDNAPRLSEVFSKPIREQGFNLCVGGAYYLSI